MTFSFKIDLPINLRLKINGEEVKAAVGRTLARKVKAQIEGGQGADGALPAPQPKRAMAPAGRPLNDTGQLIKSIRYDKKNSLVLPSGKRSDGKRNMAILAIQLANRPELANADPMGVTDKMDGEANAAAEREIERQFKKGKGGLVAELKRIK